jgi:hypothetical protein
LATWATVALYVVLVLAGVALGYALARHRLRPPPPEPEPEPEKQEEEAPVPVVEEAPKVESGRVAFALGAARGTAEWSSAMAVVGERFAAQRVCAVVFVHGTFAGSDPLSAYGVVERLVPAVGKEVAQRLRKVTRAAADKVLGDYSNFGAAYVRLFEDAINAGADPRIACTEFTWSSENHHVGRLEAALSLVRVLATHAELSGGRVLVQGHSHGAQLFALVTQLLARSMATDAILDVARVRGLDIGALERDLATLASTDLDFVTYGAPERYAWAKVPRVRVLHVLQAAEVRASGDWVQKIAAAGSDFPALGAEDRRLNAALEPALGAGFSPRALAKHLASVAKGTASEDAWVLVDYGGGKSGLAGLGVGHGAYTRFDAMLFNANLVAERLYPDNRARMAASR